MSETLGMLCERCHKAERQIGWSSCHACGSGVAVHTPVDGAVLNDVDPALRETFDQMIALVQQAAERAAALATMNLELRGKADRVKLLLIYALRVTGPKERQVEALESALKLLGGA